MAPSSKSAGTRRWVSALMLALLPINAVAETLSAADFYVRSLPGVPKNEPPIKMHAGHIEITPEHNGNLFFWHFQNQHIANKQRTVIWLNGGPGCSSEDGALMEIGPYRVKDKDTLVRNNGSWHEFANLLFVDNPVGTGYSYVDTDSYVTELDQMAKQFIQFLEKFFAIFPEYDRDDIYIAGESYAGQHIPYIAKAILERNKQKSDDAWNLSGLLIGNGWISPNDQGEAYIDYAIKKKLIDKNSEDGKHLLEQKKRCRAALDANPGHIDYGECEAILTGFLDATRKSSGKDACYNMYDVRLRDEYPSCGMNWPPDLSDVGEYLRQEQVTGALHVNPERVTGWEECKGAVGSAFRQTKAKPSVHLLPDLLKQVPILLFSGAEDMICNHMGTETMINNMEWNGGKGFEVTAGNWAPRRDWTFEGEIAGFWQEARNLTYVLFHNASHMVPFDYPRRTRDMLDRFMKVDISDIGGKPTDSRIDGEKGPDTTIGGAHNTTKQEEVQEKLKQAKWDAYRRSGEVVLVFVILAAGALGFFVWRQRRKGAAYSMLRGGENGTQENGKRKVSFRRNLTDEDLEASAAFTDTSRESIPLETTSREELDQYSIGDDTDDEEETKGKAPAHNGESSGSKAQ